MLLLCICILFTLKSKVLHRHCKMRKHTSGCTCTNMETHACVRARAHVCRCDSASMHLSSAHTRMCLSTSIHSFASHANARVGWVFVYTCMKERHTQREPTHARTHRQTCARTHTHAHTHTHTDTHTHTHIHTHITHHTQTHPDTHRHT